jgi:hypothetical protein
VTASEPRRVRITPGTALRAAVTALAAVAVLVALDRSRPVIEWLITAAAVALLLDGPVHALAGRVHRGVAVAAITVTALALLAVLGYGVAVAAVEQYSVVSTAAPDAAADLERSARFGDLAQRLRLAERTRHAVDTVPTAVLGTPTSAGRRDHDGGGAGRGAGAGGARAVDGVVAIAAGARVRHRLPARRAAARHRTPKWAAALALLALAAAELAALQLDRTVFRIADDGLPRAFVSAVAFSAGFERAGVVGAVVTLVVAHLAVGVLRSLAASATAVSAPSAPSPAAPDPDAVHDADP